ncbi:MAG TPA: hypothetical protein PK079_25115 [Leptospiraceae bacterium]|nr:hypothetical protein [Leptospiraceae bacterium]HMW08587.1 hypothetical protein [Leptospiraceae bacterium]HMZ66546.1 hypothetical protein [Leptospiraceae bacterium]HNA10234.1 hypothetical protein [Leptospiraceae bacterium]HNB98550.1 hypothetical protein [Leptospiraceae bacterium]
MSSIIGKAKSVFAGRETVGLTGIYQGSETTIDIDLVSSLSTTHNVTVSSHPIEKDKDNTTLNSIVDHVVTANPNVKITCIISSNLGSKTAKDKLKILLAWQSLGALVKLEGYTTGGGILTKVIQTLNRGWGSAFSSELEEPHYVGIDTDLIQNLVLGNISITRKSELGEDIEVTIDLTRIQFATAQSVNRTVQKSSAQVKVGSKGQTPVAQTNPAKTVVKGLGKTNFGK